MKDRRIITSRDIILALALLVLVLGFVYLSVVVFGLNHGYIQVVGGVLFVVTILFIDRARLVKGYWEAHKALMVDLELKDVLYHLLEKTSSYGPEDDIYKEMLSAAIHAIKNGHKGSILDVRDEKKVKYVAIEGFEKSILEQMGLGLKDTYLYKETKGAMNQTVIIGNSVNYNKLHSNDDIISDLIEAGTAGVKSTLCTPIIVQNKTIGMINIDSTIKDAFTPRDIQIIEIFALEVGKMIQYYEIIQENLYLSRFDSMTKIYNRGYFYDRHREIFMKEPTIPYIFVAMDIDNLKEVNDAYGHMVGDQLLVKFVETIKKYLPEQAIFGRYGGDEFNIILPHSSHGDVVQIMKQSIQDLKNHQLVCKDDYIQVLFSYGAVAYPEEESDYKQLIVIADERMYQQKNGKKGLWQSKLTE